MDEVLGVKVNYEEAKKNHMRSDASKAVQTFLCGEEGTIMTVFPQALNSILKALESLGLWKQAIVLPSSDEANKPMYIILKIGPKSWVDDLLLGRGVGE